MSHPLPSRSATRGGASRVARILGLTLVCILVAALATATFVFSYAGMHTFAMQAGIQGRFARGYPLLVDAMIVIAGVSVITLRGAGLPSKFFAWLILLIMLGAAAGADAIRASGHKMPGKYASIIAAVVPWVLAFLAFILLLVMLRYVRLRMLAAARDRIEAQEALGEDSRQLTVRRPGLSGHAPVRPGQPGSFGQGPFAQDPSATQTLPHRGQLDQGTGAAPPIVPGFDRSAAGQAGFAHQVLAVPRQPGPSSVADAGDNDRIAVDRQSAASAASDDADATAPDEASETASPNDHGSEPSAIDLTKGTDPTGDTGLAGDADPADGAAATGDADVPGDDQVDMRFHQLSKQSGSASWTITSDSEPASQASAASADQSGAGRQAEGKAEHGRPADLKDKAEPGPESGQPAQKSEPRRRSKPRQKPEPPTQADSGGQPEPSAGS